MPIQLSNEGKVNSVICAAISWNHSNTSLIQSTPSIHSKSEITKEFGFLNVSHAAHEQLR